MATTKKSAKSAKTNVNVFESVFANLSDGINAKKAAEELAAQLKAAYSKRINELAKAKTEKKAEKKTVTPSAKGEKKAKKAEKKAPAKVYRYEQVADLSKLGLAFKDYSEKAFAIFSTKKVEVENSKGEKVSKTATIHCQKVLEELGGSYSPRLSCGEGYIFSKKKSLEAVKAALPFLFAKKATATAKKAPAKKGAKKVKAA